MISLAPKPKFPAATEARIGGQPVSIAVRVSERARSYRLSIPNRGGPVLTVPRHGRWSEAEAFLHRQTAWLEARLKRVAPATPLVVGARIPVRGVPHLVTPTGHVRGRVETAMQDGEAVLLVPGDPEHQKRRLMDWLKAEAQADLEERVLVHSRALGVSAKSVRLRSQATRWGSCASSGRLNFNWRLILAPPFVLDYVAAHEVAHLVHMNHSPAFWRTVEKALPDMARGRAWLRAHGSELMSYGDD